MFQFTAQDVSKPTKTRYLTLEQGTTKVSFLHCGIKGPMLTWTLQWIGVDSKYIAITTTTSTNEPGETVVATITNGVTAFKNAAGNFDILLSPAIQEKLGAIAEQVVPCAAKRRRQSSHRKRQGGVCGLAEYVQRVTADAELRNSFARPLTEQVLEEEYDSGYESGSGSEDGWVDGGAEGGAESVVEETIVFSTEEEAAALGAVFSGGEAAANSIYLAHVTADSFLALVWHYIASGQKIPNAHEIPKERIHRVSKTRTKTTTRVSSTSSSSSCPTGTPVRPPHSYLTATEN